MSKKQTVLCVLICLISAIGGARLQDWGRGYLAYQERRIACAYLDRRLLQTNSTSKATAKSFAQVIGFMESECWMRK